MQRVLIVLLAMGLVACAKTHKDPQDLRARAAAGFWGTTLEQDYLRLFADVMYDMQQQVKNCYGGGAVRGSRPGSGSNFSVTSFYPEINRNDAEYKATILIWRVRGTASDRDEILDKRRVMFIIDIAETGEGRTAVKVMGPRRGWNDEMQAFLHWADGGDGQCSWR